MSKQKEIEYFIQQDSIVRRIWNESDTVLFIFAGAAAEFALSKAVDWLYYTGRLPSDPMGRLFSTVSYAQRIIFANRETALQAIDSINAIHKNVEADRGAGIPDWAYRDVLFLLIDYSIRSFELLERKLTLAEKEEVFCVFLRVGERMEITGLPQTFKDWKNQRKEHLQQNLEYSRYTANLNRQYRKQLGWLRYKILLEVQTLLVNHRVRVLMGFRKTSYITPLLRLYQVCKRLKIGWVIKSLLLPAQYKRQARALEKIALFFFVLQFCS